MQPLLITGEMRSGTTFLANFLNSQKDMVVYADMLVSFFMEAHTLEIIDIHRKLSVREKNVLLSNLIQEGKLHQLDFSVIDRSDDLSWQDIFNKSLTIIKGDEPATVVGIKRTREENYLSQLLEAGVKVIFCIRDPRDVIISAKNRFAGFDLFKSADNWKQSVNLAMGLQGHSNFMVLRFEDLILRKEETSHKIENFLGCSVSLEMNQLNFGKDKKYKDNSSFGDVKQLFDPQAVNRWKFDTENEAVHFCDVLLGKEMERLGYVKATEKSSALGHHQKLLRAYRKHKRRVNLSHKLKELYKAWLK